MFNQLSCIARHTDKVASLSVLGFFLATFAAAAFSISH